MRRALLIMAVAGHLVCIQAVAGALVWCSSPWPWLSLILTIGWLALVVIDLRHPRLAGALPLWQRTIAMLVAQSPALVFGAWNVLYFCGFAPRFELGAFVIQLWLTPVMPLLAFCPTGVVLERDLWLWALSLAPFLVIALLLVMSVRPLRGEPQPK